MPIGGKRTVLITGCRPGDIGYALARAFHSSGLHVFATAPNEKALAGLTVIGIEALSLEITSQDNITGIKNYIHERTGGSLNYLVNDAGRNYTVPALDIDFAKVQSVFESNISALMRLCQAFAPLLIQAKGTIINIGSVAATIPYGFGFVYNASKAALHCYSDTLRVELAPFEVRVIVVITGGVKSNICRIHRELSEGSLYLPLDVEYKRRQLHPQEAGMITALYAAKVVKTVLKPHPACWVWKGAQASKVWLLLTFFPRIFWDYYIATLFNMGKLAKSVKAQQKID